MPCACAQATLPKRSTLQRIDNPAASWFAKVPSGDPSPPTPEPFDAASRQNDDDDALAPPKAGRTAERAVPPAPPPAGAGVEVRIAGRGGGQEPEGNSSMSGFKVAIAGATGNVGREMLSILAERRFPVSEVVALASSRSIGKEVSFGDRTLKCKALEHYDFSDTDICLMSAGGAVSKEYLAEDRRQGLRRHRQFVRLADGPGRAARRAGGQRRRGPAVSSTSTSSPTRTARPPSSSWR